MSISNSVRLVGRPVEKDLNLKYSEQSKAYLSFTLAVNELYGGKKITNYFKVVAFDKIANTIFKNLKNNGRIIIDGVLRNNNYEDGNGNMVYAVNVIALKVDIIDFRNNNSTNEELSADNSNEHSLELEKELQKEFEPNNFNLDEIMGK